MGGDLKQIAESVLLWPKFAIQQPGYGGYFPLIAAVGLGYVYEGGLAQGAQALAMQYAVAGVAYTGAYYVVDSKLPAQSD